ncbi:hypothetical protein GWI33_017810 [Rhynchophorus ferrugineus]|uniref:CST complex subunit CTC1 n=1 Tax=Rhynchophorus ferrugineus TaxID=354439 RepID=A0A834I1B5_RHYFE|nr:hypothetical protein GWI33_017810 [Rhynchophorus ferrugineus]
MSNFKSKFQYDKIIKGTVTKIQFSLLYFEIDDKFRIYIDLTKNEGVFPKLADKVEIVDPIAFHGPSYTAVIGPLTNSQFPSVMKLTNSTDIDFYNFLRTNNCNEHLLMSIDKILRKFNYVSNSTMQKMIKLIFGHLTRNNKNNCSNFENINIKVPTDLDYVNKDSRNYSFLKFSDMFHYGVFPSQSVYKANCNSDLLFGYIEFDFHYGWFILKDPINQIPLLFYENIVDPAILDSYVVINKWLVFTEIFEEDSVNTLSYILIKSSDISIVQKMEREHSEQLLLNRTDICRDRGNSLKVQILRKSEIVFGYNSVPEYWIEMVVHEKNGKTLSPASAIFIILHGKYSKIYPFLKENKFYNIYYNKDMEKLNIISYKELYGLRTAKYLFKISEDAVFQETCDNPDVQLNKSIDLNQIMEFKENEVISLSLMVSKKTIQCNKFPPFIAKRHKNMSHFGIPGKNNQMQLDLYDSDHKKYITLYFTDRDNYRYPIGLINDMKIIVKHVQVHKNNYVKTTVFTSFEILEYSPKMLFSSVNLCFTDRSTWLWRKKSPQVLLGMYEYLPQNCIVNGKFLLIAILNLKFNLYCYKCHSLLRDNCCPDSEIANSDFSKNRVEIKMSLLVQDAVTSTFKIYTDNEDFLYDLLGFTQEKEVQSFLRTFSSIGLNYIDFTKTFPQSDDRNEDTRNFLEVFTEHIRTVVNFCQYPFVDAVCIRQSISSHPWKMVEFHIIE